MQSIRQSSFEVEPIDYTPNPLADEPSENTVVKSITMNSAGKIGQMLNLQSSMTSSVRKEGRSVIFTSTTSRLESAKTTPLSELVSTSYSRTPLIHRISSSSFISSSKTSISKTIKTLFRIGTSSLRTTRSMVLQ
jgi:hypothetical protein